LMRAAVIRRYHLLPYFYNQFYYASLTGVPVLRPLLMEFADDPKTYDIQEEFLIGKDLLIKPVGQEGQQQADVYLPGTQPWYDYETGKQYTKTPRTVTVKTPIHTIPVFQRGGSILPLKLRVRRSSTQTVNDPYTLKVALDSQLSASGELYIDDGQSFNYKNGDYVFRQFTFQNNVLKCNQGNVTENPIKPNGKFVPSNVVERVVIYGYPTKPNSISVDTKEVNEAGVPLYL
jgi:alpha 1,3-glucosidase